MNKGMILYKSKYGSAKKYAEWLQGMTGFECRVLPKGDGEDLSRYETIILCGGIYASGIAGLPFFKKNIGKWKGKKTAIFCVGASPYEERAFEELKARNLTGDLREIPLFYGRGAWDEGKMKFVDKTLCGLLKKSIAKKDPNSYEPWMKALMDAAGQSCDWTDQKYLTPLLEYLKL